MAKKTKHGTTQSILMDDDSYAIEAWYGSWIMADAPRFPTKKEADRYGFQTFPNHRR